MTGRVRATWLLPLVLATGCTGGLLAPDQQVVAELSAEIERAEPAPPAGPRVELSLVGKAVSGRPVTLRIHVVDPAATWTTTAYSFDMPEPADEESTRVHYLGGEAYPGHVDGWSNRPVCQAPRPDLRRPTDATEDLSLVVHRPGTYRAWVRIRSGDCSPRARRTAVARLTYTVADGHWLYRSNGPAEPRARIDFVRSHFDPPQVVEDGPGFQLSGSDEDGFVSRLVVDWGDGSPPETFANRGCSDWFAYRPQDHVARPDHEYAGEGPWTITLTAYSIGCDGSHEQSHTATRSFAG